MRTAVGAPDPRDWDSKQPHNIFNDRRIGGKSKNRAVRKSFYNPKMVVKPVPPPHAEPKWNQGKRPKPLYDEQMKEHVPKKWR